MGYHQEKHSDSELSSDHPTPLSYLSFRSQMRFSKQWPSILSSAVSFSTPVVEAHHLVLPCTAQDQRQIQLRGETILAPQSKEHKLEHVAM